MLKDKTIAEKLEEVFEKKKYKFFTSPLSVNIFAIRCETGTDEFDDIIGIAYYDSFGDFSLHTFKGTTEPGRFYLNNPLREEGCAIMVENQYLGVYEVGPHGRTGYEACRQAKNIKVYRDNNGNNQHDLDPSTIQEGIFYTNIHHGWDAAKVGKNSAGCIVIQSKQQFTNIFMPLVKQSAKLCGKRFSFTLLNKKDFE